MVELIKRQGVRGEGDATMTFSGFEFPSDHRVMARYSFAIFPSFVFH